MVHCRNSYKFLPVVRVDTYTELSHNIANTSGHLSNNDLKLEHSSSKKPFFQASI